MTSSSIQSLLKGIVLDAALHDVALRGERAVDEVDPAGAGAEPAELAALQRQDRAVVERAVGGLAAVHPDPSVDRARVRLEQAASQRGLDVPRTAAGLVAAPTGRTD